MYTVKMDFHFIIIWSDIDDDQKCKWMEKRKNFGWNLLQICGVGWKWMSFLCRAKKLSPAEYGHTRVTYPVKETIEWLAVWTLHTDTIVDEHDLDSEVSTVGDCRNFSGDTRERLHSQRWVMGHCKTSVLLWNRLGLYMVGLLETRVWIWDLWGRNSAHRRGHPHRLDTWLRCQCHIGGLILCLPWNLTIPHWLL